MKIIRHFIQWLIYDPWSPEEDLPVLNRRQAVWAASSFAGAVVVLCLLAAVGNPLDPRHAPLWFAPLTGALVLVLNGLSQVRDDKPLHMDFTHPLVLTALFATGGSLSMLVALMFGGGLSTYRLYMRNGRFANRDGTLMMLLNGSLMFWQSLASVVVIVAARPIIGSTGWEYWMLAPVLLAVYIAVDPIVTGVWLWAGKLPVSDLRDFVIGEAQNLAFHVPFLVLGMALVQHTWTAVFAMVAPTVVAASATRPYESLVVARRELTLDGLTGLANKQFFWNRLAEDVRTADERQFALGIMILDIDNFKVLNDTLGHLEGDKALHATGVALANAMRDHDLAARYGGEEFVVIMPDTDELSLRRAAEAVRLNVAEALAPWQTTASLGIALRMPGGLMTTELVEHADQALYRAKHEGKNRVVCAEAA